MDAARKFFESLSSDDPTKPLRSIERLIAEEIPEGVHHDYITSAAFKRHPTFNLENIAKPLSGFANAEGGVVLYGVSCRAKDTQRRDLPTEIDPTAPSGLLDAITDIATERVSPAITNIEFKNLEDGGKQVIAVLVPPSRVKPHQIRETHLYYRRTDDDFKILDHHDLELIFRARHAAELNVFPLVTLGESKDIYLQRERLKLVLSNRGNSPALNVSIHFDGAFLEQVGVLAARETCALDGDKDAALEAAWKRVFDTAWTDVTNQHAISVNYTDIAGARYQIAVPCGRPERGKEQFFLGKPTSIVREGLNLT